MAFIPIVVKSQQCPALTTSRDGGNGAGSITRHQGKAQSHQTSALLLFRASQPCLSRNPNLFAAAQGLWQRPGLSQHICGFHICFYCLEEAFREATEPGLLTVFLATQGFKILQMDQNLCYFDL